MPSSTMTADTYEDSKIAAMVSSSIKEKQPAYRLCDHERFEKKSNDAKRYPKKVRKYFTQQSSLLQAYEKDAEHLAGMNRPRVDGADEQQRWCDNETALTTATFACNFALLVGKIAATILSGSLSIMSSMVDSLVDNTSNVVIWMTSRAIRNRDPYHYPRGRTRLEPLALVIISVIMGIASVQVIAKTIEALINDDLDLKIFIVPVNATSTDEWELDLRIAGVMVATIVLKLILCICCYVFARNSPTIMVLAQDHRNDCMSNSVAIACGVLGQLYWRYLDSIGAIAISLYIATSWIITGYRQISILSGRSASPYFISRIIKICLDHHEAILHVDAVTVYHFSTQFLVEVDIVVDPNTTVRHAHDISDPLQRKIEYIADVERAFVHVEYQTKHSPSIEHKTV